MPARIALTCLFLSSVCRAESITEFTWVKAGDGVYAAVSDDHHKSQSNAGFVVGSEGVLVVDTFIDEEPARLMVAKIREVTNLPIRWVVNTHYHFDHTAGNGVFAAAGATILAHRNLRAWLRTENFRLFGSSISPEDKALIEALVLPSVTYTDAVDIYVGKRLVQVRYMPGHTGGDSVVIVPDANVVFCGDLFWQGRAGNLIDASTLPWIQTLDKLAAEHPTATFVSGHGLTGTAAEVRAFRDYFITLRAEVAKAQKEGKSGDALVAAVLPTLESKYPHWQLRHLFKLNIAQTAAELSGTKKVPVPPAP